MIPLDLGVEAGVAWVKDVGLVDGRAVATETGVTMDEVDWEPGAETPGLVGAVVG